jgi:hypothetical protein
MQHNSELRFTAVLYYSRSIQSQATIDFINHHDQRGTKELESSAKLAILWSHSLILVVWNIQQHTAASSVSSTRMQITNVYIIRLPCY